MSKKDKQNKATESAKKAQKAIKSGKAKHVEETPVEAVRVSEHALDGEKQEWNAELDAAREVDFQIPTMTERAARVLRQQRLRQLKKGSPIQLDGAAGALELDVQTTTEAPPLPEGMAPLHNVDDVAAELGIDLNESKKERKARLKAEAAATEQLAAEQKAAAERAEAYRLAAIEAAEAVARLHDPKNMSKKERKAAKQLAKEQEAAAAFVPKASSSGGTPIDLGDAAPAVAKTPGTRAPRLDPIHDALTQAQREANETGKPVEREAPREYVNKNYGLRLAEKYAPQFPGLTALDDKFNAESGRFIVTFKLVPQS